MIITINTVILAVNIFTFFLFGFDKLMAKKKGSRIPELVLLSLAFLFGGAGAVFGMIIFNHKTSKMKFRILVPVYVFLNYYLMVDNFRLLKELLSKILQIIPE